LFQWRLTERVPIHVTPDLFDHHKSEEFQSTASVQLQAPRSVQQLLAADDVNLRRLT